MNDVSSNTSLRIEQLSKFFGAKKVLDNITFSVNVGQIVTIIGPNGSGKSTLIESILDIDTRYSGRILKQDIKFGYLPQNIDRNYMLPITVAEFFAMHKEKDQNHFIQLSQELDAEKLLQTSLHNLSNGERQRVFLLSAMLNKPNMLILDEPTSALDIQGQISFYRIIEKWKNQYNMGILMVSHDLNMVMKNSDKIICMNHHVCCEGLPSAVASHTEFKKLFPFDAISPYMHHHDHKH